MDTQTQEIPRDPNVAQGIRIVSRTETGQLQLHDEELGTILTSVDPELNSLPVAILCVTGSRGSGKSFYANLLLEYLKNEGKPHWLKNLCHNEGGMEFLRGFPYGSPDSDIFTGVYMWPSPFFVQSENGDKMIAWILDIHIKEEEEMTTGVDPLGLFIHLICSKIVEIVWKHGNAGKNRTCRNLLQECDLRQAKVCDNQTFLYRFANDDQERSVQLPRIKADDLLFANHVNVWDPESQLHTPEGDLTIGTGMQVYLMNFAQYTLGDEGNLRCKEVDVGKPLTQGTFKDFLKSSVNTINQTLIQVPPCPELGGKTREGQEVLKTDQKPNDDDRESRPEDNDKVEGGDGEVKNDPENNSRPEPQEEGETEHQNAAPDNQNDENEMENQSSEESEKMTIMKQLPPHFEDTDKPSHLDVKKEESETRTAIPEIPENQSLEELRQELLVLQLKLRNDIEEVSAEKQKFEAEEEALAQYKRKLKEDTTVFESKKGVFQMARTVAYEALEVLKLGRQQLIKERQSLELERTEVENLKQALTHKEWHLMTKEQTLERNSAHLKDKWDQFNEKKQRFREKKERFRNDKEELTLKFVSEAEAEIKTRMEAGLKEWATNLTFASIHQLESLYGEVLDEVACHWKSKKGCASVYKQFYEELSAATSDWLGSSEQIRKAVSRFHSKLEADFISNTVLPPEDLEKRLDTALTSSVEDVSPENLEYVRQACGKLIQLYQEQNSEILKAEEVLSEAISKRIQDSYSNIMSKFIKNEAPSPAVLGALNHSLLVQYSSALQTETPDKSLINQSEVKALRSKLKQKFQAVRVENRKALQQQHKALNSLIQKSKRDYDVKMNEALRKPEMGPETLTQIHEEAVREIKVLLEVHIRNKLGTNEPVEVHSPIFEAHAADAIPLLLDEVRKIREKTNMFPTGAISSHNGASDKAESKISEVGAHKTLPTSAAPMTPAGSPLVAQLSLTGIRLGYWENEQNFKVLESTPAVVGLTLDNRWVCGQNAMKPYQGLEPRIPRDDLQKLWRIGEHFLSGAEKPWSDTIQVDNNTHEIGLEFLLGMLFRHLKHRTEAEAHLKFNDILVTVPFWFGSSHRQQVKDSGGAAGFGRVYIANENSAAAWGYLKSVGGNQSYEMTVLSENSNLVDVTIFSYDSSRIQTMIGHCGSYQVNQTPKKGSFSDFIKKIANISPYSETGLKFSSKEYEKWCYERTRETRRKARDSAYSFRSKHATSSPVYKVVIVTYEYPRWKDVLLKIGLEYEKLPFEANNELVLLGAGYLSREPWILGDLVKDRLSLDFVRSTKDTNATVYSSTDETLSCKKPMELESQLPAWDTRQAYFYQKIMDAKILVGAIAIIRPSGSHVPTPTFQIFPDGIISLKSLQMKNQSYNPFSTPSYFGIPGVDYDWHPESIGKETLARITSLLEDIQRQEASRLEAESEMASGMQELLVTGNGILEMIEKGEGNFRSDLGRNMIKKQVQEALDLVSRSKFDLREVNKQTNNFKLIIEKYFTK